MVHDPHHALNNVIYVGEVSFHLAVVEDLNGSFFQNSLGEKKKGHVRTAPRPVDREETQARCGQAVEVAVTVSHELVGLLCGCIYADGMVDVMVNRKRHLGIQAIDRTA